MWEKLEPKFKLLETHGYTLEPTAFPACQWVKTVQGVESYYTPIFFTDDGTSVIPQQLGASMVFYAEEWDWRSISLKEFNHTLIKIDEILKEKAATAYNEEVNRILEVL